MKKKIAYVLPAVTIGGGPSVVFQHANRLIKRGYEVAIINLDTDLKSEANWFKCNFPIFNWDVSANDKCPVKNIDIAIATYFSTLEIVKNKIKAERKIYFVQSDERRFDLSAEEFVKCQKSYQADVEFITEAKWIQRWLKEEFGKNVYYVPNGLDEKIFFPTAPLVPKTKKVRVLLEGPIDVPFKGVADAYNAVKDLNCELWIISSLGKPKRNWRYDRFFERVPMEKMNEIYSSCDILLKMSKVEGFFGPPLEAMACGCVPVVAECTGFDEYIQNKKNALTVAIGDVKAAKNAVRELLNDSDLREKIRKTGIKTARQWSWEQSIDCLEKVIKKEPIKIFYNNENPRRYDFEKTMSFYQKDVIKNSLDRIQHLCFEKKQLESRSQTLQRQLDLMRHSRIQKLKEVFLKIKHWTIFLFLNPRKFIKKYLIRK